MEDSSLIIEASCKKRFQPVCRAIDELLKSSKKDVLIVAIDGKCASGKTTLGYYLKALYSCNIFHMDDFFLQKHQRTVERLSEVGGNVDYERFNEEVLKPLTAKKEICYRPFSCADMKISDGTIIKSKKLNIIEGSYSMHPYFGKYYDIGVFTDISSKQQIDNILKRNGQEKFIRFREEWIPKENSYFEKFNIKDGCINIMWEK